MKPSPRFFIGLLSLFLFISHASSAEPLYWKAQKGGKELLILGSVHVGDQSMYPLPRAIIDYLKQSDGLIVEADIRQAENLQYPKTKYTSAQVLSPHLKEKLIEASRTLKLNSHSLLVSPPWASALTLQMKQFESMGYQTQYGIDSFLITQAEQHDIPVLGLESLQFQIDLLTKLPNDGEDLLISGLEEWDKAVETTQCMMTSWKKGDSHNLASLGVSSEISPELSERFVYSRNHNWVEQLNSDQFIADKSKHLLVVGSLHTVGEQNLLALLKGKGFKVTQLSSSSKADCAF
ncbi:TraB/GumN family protein [Vibrio profundi]|uniref:TraB/GumN family protein n=1 Tax=Vibrio profundi TaxID=1774960 RepID=UPI0037354DBB